MIDNQWPSPYLHAHTYDASLDETNNEQSISRIEAFFQDRFGFEAILLPSGRAAIGLIIRFHGINRGHKVFVTKWSSHCQFYTVGAFSNVTVDFIGSPDLIVINHKWGSHRLLQTSYPDSILLEDSVDSIHLSERAFFRNGGDYEIISLPKLLGCYSGSILFSRNYKLTDYARVLQQKNIELGKHQSYLKSLKPEKWDNFANPYWHEPWNTSLDANALENISSSLYAYDKNRDLILHRQYEIKCKLGIEVGKGERVGPVVPLPISKYRLQGDTKLLIRHFSFSPYLEAPFYKQVYVLPVHFGISTEAFERLLGSVSLI